MFQSPLRQLRRFGPVAVASLVACVSVAAPVSARTLVDPSTLTPPIPLTSNPVCSWVGAEVMCSSDRNFTVTDSSTGIICEDGELLESSERHVFGLRYFNSDLYLVESRFLEQIEGVLYVPGSGSVRWTGTDYDIQVLSVPGDRSTGIGTNSGAGIHLYPNSGGSISLAGRSTENVDTGEFSFTGNNPQVDFCSILS